MALLDVLRALARDAPVLVALDDLQWLDPSSASRAAGRAAAAGRASASGVLATARGTPAAPGAWEPTGLRVRSLEPLGIGALQDLLRERLGRRAGAPAARAPARGVGRQPVLRTGARAGARADGVPESLRGLLGGPHRVAAAGDRRGAPAGRRARAADRGSSSARRTATPDVARAALEAAGDVLGQRRRAAALRPPAARVAVLRPRDAVAPARRAPPARRRRHRRRGARPAPRARDHRSRMPPWPLRWRPRPPARQLVARRWPPLSSPSSPAIAPRRVTSGDLPPQAPGGRLACSGSRGDLERAAAIYDELVGDHAAGPATAPSCCTSWH